MGIRHVCNAEQYNTKGGVHQAADWPEPGAETEPAGQSYIGEAGLDDIKELPKSVEGYWTRKAHQKQELGEAKETTGDTPEERWK